MIEFFKLLYVFFKVKLFHLQEELNVRKHFYKDFSFKKSDTSLSKEYRFLNPYKISKNFLLQKEEKMIHAYGETPLSTLNVIAKECNLTSNDHVVDLGCGRGRGVFFLSHFLKCKAAGIEWVPSFIEKANLVKEQANLNDVSFLHEEIYSCSLSPYTAIYLYGTCLEEEEILRLISSFKKVSEQTKIITISYPLSDYDPENFKLIKSFPVKFPWGETEAFLNCRT